MERHRQHQRHGRVEIEARSQNSEGRESAAFCFFRQGETKSVRVNIHLGPLLRQPQGVINHSATGGAVKCDTTTLEDFSVIAKLRADEE